MLLPRSSPQVPLPATPSLNQFPISHSETSAAFPTIPMIQPSAVTSRHLSAATASTGDNFDTDHAMVLDSVLGLLSPMRWEVLAMQPVALLQICNLEAAESAEVTCALKPQASSLKLCFSSSWQRTRHAGHCRTAMMQTLLDGVCLCIRPLVGGLCHSISCSLQRLTLDALARRATLRSVQEIWKLLMEGDAEV